LLQVTKPFTRRSKHHSELFLKNERHPSYSVISHFSSLISHFSFLISHLSLSLSLSQLSFVINDQNNHFFAQKIKGLFISCDVISDKEVDKNMREKSDFQGRISLF
jgi:hypothetical protein